WWAKHQHGFPYLARLAVVHLAILATSATSERVYSAPGNTVTKKRNRLRSEMVDALVVLHDSYGVAWSECIRAMMRT
ncbi:unnamed protein product, partial [Discosporangium mesarthrocarpum]